MIEQSQCTVFKYNLLRGLENFYTGTPYVYKIALYTAFATIGPDTLVYTTSNEITGTGYSAGGIVLTPIGPTYDLNNDTAYVSFNNAVWNPASFTARGALIYNSTTSNAVAVLDFGSDKTATNTFTVTFPADTSTTAVLRIS